MDTIRPPDAAALVDTVAWAVANKTPLELIGRGTKRALGRPVQAAHLLDVSGFSGIFSYEPGELVLTAGAGTPLAEIEAALEAANQHFAFEPPDYGRLLGGEPGGQSIGGVVASNLAGPRRLTAGAGRDHLLGFAAVSGRGEAFKSGGKVVKNVTGYDLSKLVSGSWGTLAVLTEVSLKVLPRPETVMTMLLRGLKPAEAVACMSRALGSAHDVSAAAWLPGGLIASTGLAGSGSVTALRLEGPPPSVAFRANAVAALFGGAERLEGSASTGFWQAVRDVEPLADEQMRQIWKISVPPMAGAAILSAYPKDDGFLDWAGGLVWLALPPTPDAGAERLRALVAAHGGHATLIRADAATRAAVAVFEPGAAPLAALAQRVKHVFDPEGILNPGRLQAGL